MGADPPTDLRFDLPVLDRADVSDANKLDEYADAWLPTDTQVALVASRFVSEAWARGFRKPSYIADAPAWSAGTPVEAWKQMIGADLRRVASSTKEAMIQHIDQIGELGISTILDAAEIAVQYNLQTAPSQFSIIEGKIPDAQRRAEYAAAHTWGTLLAARERVLGWTFQHWYGERYQLPEMPGEYVKSPASDSQAPASDDAPKDPVEIDGQGHGTDAEQDAAAAIESNVSAAEVPASLADSGAPAAALPPTPAGKPFQFRATGGVHTLPGAIELADGSVVIAKEAQAELRSRLRSERDYAANYKLLRREMQQKIAASQRAAEDGKVEADAIRALFVDIQKMTPDERYEYFERFDSEVPKLRLEIEKQKFERQRAALLEEQNPTTTAEEATEARQEALQSELRATYTRVMEHPSVKALDPEDVRAVFRKHAGRLERLVSKDPDGTEMFDDAEVMEDLDRLIETAARLPVAGRAVPTDPIPDSPEEPPFPPGVTGVYDPAPPYGDSLT